MFYEEEDVLPAVQAAVEAFGPVGVMSDDRDTLKNVSIATREFGKLWYGDVSTEQLRQGCSQLSGRINQKVYALMSDGMFDLTDICSDTP